MSQETYQEYLKILDQEITKRNSLTSETLLKILEMSQESWEKSEMFTNKRKVIWFRLLEKQMENLDSRDMISLKRQLDNANINPDNYTNFFVTWEATLVRKLKSSELIDILRIYHDMQVKLPVQLLDRWSDQAQHEVNNWSAEDLAFVIYAFSQLKLRPSNGFLEKWADAVETKLRKFQPLDLSNFVYGVGKLWISNEKIEEILRKTISEWDSTQIKSMTAQQLIKIAEGLIELKLNPQKLNNSFMEMWTDKITATIKRLSPRDLARSGWVMARFQYLPKKSFIEDWKDQTLTKIASYEGRDLYLSLVSAVHFEMINDKQFERQWLEAAEAKIGKFWPSAIAATLLDLHYLQAAPSKQFFKAWAKACTDKFTDMYAKDLVSTMVGLSLYHEHPKRLNADFKSEWNKQMSEKIDCLSISSVEDLEQAFETLQLTMAPELANMLVAKRKNWKRDIH